MLFIESQWLMNKFQMQGFLFFILKHLHAHEHLS